MSADLIPGLSEQLPVRQRLALVYAPLQSRANIGALLVLDSRLAAIVRSAREPMLAQLRLAWWREQIASNPANRPQGEPLLAALSAWERRVDVLVTLVDAWEAMTGEAPLAPLVFERLAEARAGAFAALPPPSDQAETARAARNWASVDIAGKLSRADERSAAWALAKAHDWRPPRLPRSLRPLAVLHGLAARDLRRRGNADTLSPRDLIAAMRLGLLGR